jgi:hypothetical protein
MTTRPAISKEQYLHQAQFALFGCQMVEETLKSFLMYAREINRLSAVELAPINKSDEELDETPLGGLIKLFRSASPNPPIITELEQLRPERNHCAHRALVLCFMSEVRTDISLEAEFHRVEKAATLAWSCFEALKPQLIDAEARLGELRARTDG